MTTIKNGVETITIDVDDYIGQQSWLGVEHMCKQVGYDPRVHGLTQTVILYLYHDYCVIWTWLYDMLIDIINNLYKTIKAE